MSDQDFVERLRIRWETMGDMANSERAAAAEEIEFLRRSQRELMGQVATLREERDEARRMYCHAIWLQGGLPPLNVAQNKGWDCFERKST